MKKFILVSSICLSFALIKATFDVPLLPKTESFHRPEVEKQAASSTKLVPGSDTLPDHASIDVKSQNARAAPRKLDELELEFAQDGEAPPEETPDEEVPEEMGIEDWPLLENSDGEIATNEEENDSSSAMIPIPEPEPETPTTKVVKLDDCAYLPYFIKQVDDLISGAQACDKHMIAVNDDMFGDFLSYASRLQLILESHSELNEGSPYYYDDDHSNEIREDEYMKKTKQYTPIIRAHAPSSLESESEHYDDEGSYNGESSDDNYDQSDEGEQYGEDGEYLEEYEDEPEGSDGEYEYEDDEEYGNENGEAYENEDNADEDEQGQYDSESVEESENGDGESDDYRSKKKIKRVLRRNRAKKDRNRFLRKFLQFIKKRKAARLARKSSRHLYRAVLSARVRSPFSHTAFRHSIHKAII